VPGGKFSLAQSVILVDHDSLFDYHRRGRRTVKFLFTLAIFCAGTALCGQDIVPKPSKVVLTPYPRLALLGNVMGDVRLVVQLRTGVPKVVRVGKAHKILVDSAVSLVERWRFDSVKDSTFLSTSGMK
jgi:hypothetical protein